MKGDRGFELWLPGYKGAAIARIPKDGEVQQG
jgi:hypothetical protein